jgi:tetratricopeptide (TPR) repeat protein
MMLILDFWHNFVRPTKWLILSVKANIASLLSILNMVFILLVCPLCGTWEETLQEANSSYQQGIHATNYQERKISFNRALSLYTLLGENIGSGVPTLDSAIADSYFQLGEYPWAILYYYRALKINPHDPLPLSHLEKAQQKLGILSAPATLTFYQRFFLNPLLVFSKKLEWFFSFILLTLFVCSFAIWFPSTWSRKLAIYCTLFLFLMICNILFFYYFAPLEGILVNSTGFYRVPDWNQPQLTNLPLLAGSKVQVIQITSDGNWLKISDSTGLVGYIPTNSLRII